MAAPDVTVIIGAYNAMPYITACLQSVVDQTIGRERLEVIAVDDGSTDATGKELDSFADQYPKLVRVIHQENSGGPSAPRNAGLDLATGRYVFFLDADDHLGPEALERLVAMADAQGSDVVLGKMVGVGRRVPQSMFTRNQPRADLYTSRVWWSRSAQKLFRRGHLEQLGLRFPTEFRVGEDQIFTARAYLAARVISVVADHDCYYLTKRDDGGNITSTEKNLDTRLGFVGQLCALIGDNVEPGPRRDHLMWRQFGIDLEMYTNGSLLRRSREEQHRVLALAQDILREWGTAEVLRKLAALHRLRFHLIERGMFDEALEVVRFEKTRAGDHDVVVEDGVAYATYPFFRDARSAVPDSCYDITRQLKTVHRLDRLEVAGAVVTLTGQARIEGLPVDAAGVEVLLRERGTKAEHRVRTRVPSTDGPAVSGRPAPEKGGFVADIDLTVAAGGEPLSRGLWDVHLVVRNRGLERVIRLGSSRSAEVDAATRTYTSPQVGRSGVFTTYFTQPHSNLTLDVDEAKHELTRSADGVRASRSPARYVPSHPTEAARRLLGGARRHLGKLLRSA